MPYRGKKIGAGLGKRDQTMRGLFTGGRENLGVRNVGKEKGGRAPEGQRKSPYFLKKVDRVVSFTSKTPMEEKTGGDEKKVLGQLC